MSYETLDNIADAYIPLLLFLSVMAVIHASKKQPKPLAVSFINLGLLLMMLMIAYGFMFLDKALVLWYKMGLDYSTHTAVSLCFVLYLCLWVPRLRGLLVTSFFVYIGLMLYQEYHVLMDILSTLVVVFPCMSAIIYWYSMTTKLVGRVDG